MNESSKMGVKCVSVLRRRSQSSVCFVVFFLFLFRLLFVVFSLHVKAAEFFFSHKKKDD